MALGRKIMKPQNIGTVFVRSHVEKSLACMTFGSKLCKTILIQMAVKETNSKRKYTVQHPAVSSSKHPEWVNANGKRGFTTYTCLPHALYHYRSDSFMLFIEHVCLELVQTGGKIHWMGIRLSSLNNLVSMNLQDVWNLYQQDRQCTLIHLAGIWNCKHSS